MKNQLLALVLFACLASCSSLKSGGGAPVVAHAGLASVQGAPILDARFDGDTFVGFGAGVGVCEVFGKVTGFPVFGPVAIQEGKVYVSSRSRDFKAELDPGEPLPAWCAPLFRQGEAESLGLSFAPAP